MNFKILVSLTVAMSFLVLAVSGFLSFLLPYSRVTAAVHSVFGFLFFCAVLPHVWNNFKSLKSYISR